MANDKLTPPKPVTVDDVYQIARQRLPKAVLDYYVTGADDEYTLERNSAVFRE